MKTKRLVEQLADIISEEELKRMIDEKGLKKPVETNYSFWGVEDQMEDNVSEKALYGRDDILREASKLINGDRAKDYGDAAENFDRIAIGWEVILGARVTNDQVALCMAWLKICRTVTSPKHKDSYLDCAGYVALAGELAGLE